MREPESRVGFLAVGLTSCRRDPRLRLALYWPRRLFGFSCLFWRVNVLLDLQALLRTHVLTLSRQRSAHLRDMPSRAWAVLHCRTREMEGM